jgi:hypothetical protein
VGAVPRRPAQRRESRHRRRATRGIKYDGERKYVDGGIIITSEPIRHAWPESWDEIWGEKMHDHPRIEQLAIAGALIAAEIDRLQRAAMNAEANERAHNAQVVREARSGI